MSNLTAQEQRERAHSFSGPIQHIANNNAAVHRILSAYAHGNIITKEEALSQMVVALSKDWSREAERAMNIAMARYSFVRKE